MAKKLIPGVSRRGRGFARLLAPIVLAVTMILAPALALAGPRSGGSFGGRMFRSGGGFSTSRGTSSYRGGSHPSFFFLPSFGWGWGGMGYGGGFGSLIVLGMLGFAAFSLVRLARRSRESGGSLWGGGGWSSAGGSSDEYESAVAAGRAYVYRMQIALGRSARGIQDRMAHFAAEGDTSTEAGLANMLQQTTLELMREKDSIRAASVEGSGPMSLTNAETKMNSLALAERARFQVERVRGANGSVRRSDAAAEEGKEALEYVVVMVVVATRIPLGKWKGISDRADLDLCLEQLAGVSSSGLLGLEVVWTPADANDSLTEIDLMTTYPDLRSV
jgi:uncharacterized membrane protein